MEATAIGGLTMGADPVAYTTAVYAATVGRSLKSFSVRKEAKDHGIVGRIAGALEPGDKVVLTEDTASRGTSILEAADAVRAFGAEPILMLTLVDRGGTAESVAREAGIPYAALGDRSGPRLRVRRRRPRRLTSRGRPAAGQYARSDLSAAAMSSTWGSTASSSVGS